MLAWRNELSEALELVSGHCAVSTPFQRQISLEVGIQVLFEGDIADESHSAQGAVELDSGKDLTLGCLGKPMIGREKES